MRTIWKYELLTTDEQTVLMPMLAELLAVQVQNDKPCVWALVDPEQKQTRRGFRVYGTEQSLPNTTALAGKYVGTYQLEGGSLVFHVFDMGSEISGDR
jgi:hypothetical protein